MTDTHTAVPQAPARTLIETNGIDIIQESERTAKPSDLFWPWFAANVSVFGMSYAAFVYGFGVSFWQGVIVTVVGVTLSFLFCGIIAIAGKRGSVPTMVLSRSAFGVKGQKVPGIFSWLISMGWETFLAIMAVLATATVFNELGWSSGTTTKVIACAVIAALIVLGSVAGYHTIMRMQSVLTWVTGLVTIGYIAITFRDIDLSAATALPAGSNQALIGALVMVMTGFGLGWINIAADWSRYQKRDASGSKIVFWNTFGGALAPVLLVCYGLALAGSNPDLTDAIANDPVGTLATILPTWFLIPFWIAAVLALVSGAILGIYSSGLTLLSLGINIPRPAAALIDGTILTLGTIYVVFFAESFLAPFQSFLITLGVPIAAWAGILIADTMLRRKNYDETALFDGRGRYGNWNWTSIAIMAVASIAGWGLVINNFADDASWNNWQGYLLGPLGLGGREGDWAWANLGVLVALVIGFVGYAALQAHAVRRQEATPVAPGDRAGVDRPVA
ncbi:purine-cytosine permease family protein [Ornithinimicrobium faecis]|uniref:Cytosine permease n=1 Tax=Ornithinimicrobium faecis TaxID=2934158 RepID=A0ABY4YX30_9MICO|nr:MULTISPECIES: cytosine permease [unclassified Ornithinimicrobium]USQ80667.1 cytosine permease [Ornithinimicrobium sp. HY1793]